MTRVGVSINDSDRLVTCRRLQMETAQRTAIRRTASCTLRHKLILLQNSINYTKG